ncbi:MAG: helix-turn-helix transcriptional regulator [Prevotella sp.]|nr:helix-turn-helix transcriptional regulator [Prevotella sp.]
MQRWEVPGDKQVSRGGYQRTNKWLAEQLGCAPTTVSKWCTNDRLPTMETYIKIARILDVSLNELV